VLVADINQTRLDLAVNMGADVTIGKHRLLQIFFLIIIFMEDFKLGL